VHIFLRSDAWLPKGLAAYLCSMYRRKAFGVNDYRYRIAQVIFIPLFILKGTVLRFDAVLYC